MSDLLDAAEEPIEEYCRRYCFELHQVKQLISGGVAGCVAKTAVGPLSRVTVLMQVQSMRPHKFADGVHPNNQSLAASIMKIIEQEGVTALWRGNVATLVHRFPYTGITFYGNNFLRGWLEQAPAAKSIPEKARGFVAGGTSASIGVLLCYPLDVVKTRLMTQTKKEYYNGIVDALRKMAQEEGRQGLYRGLGVSLASVVPSLALNFALYEEFRRLYAPLDLPSAMHALLAGGSSGATASTVLFPVDLLRRQMQMVGFGGRPEVYGGVTQACWHVFDTGRRQNPVHSNSWRGVLMGFREFFRGLLPELLKVTPNNAIMFMCYSQLMKHRWPLEHRGPDAT